MTTNKEAYEEALALWKNAKEAEQYYNKVRLAAEEELLEITKSQLKETGTNNFDGGLKIVTGHETKFDNELITKAKAEFDQMGIFFPFTITWKPDNKLIEVIKTTHLHAYKKYIEPAMTVKPKKPSFSVKEEK